MDNPFRFRGQRKDNGEWVVGMLDCLYSSGDEFKYVTVNGHEIHPSSLSISFGKLDSNKQEIFASFEIDGVMTEGGDVVQAPREAIFPVRYSQSAGGFVVVHSSGREHLIGSLDIETYTIIGKGDGNDK